MSQDARNAGLIAAILALLAGASLDVASMLGSGVAAEANTLPPPKTYTPGTTVLSGRDARDWLESKGFIKSNGEFTPAYTKWTNSIYHDDEKSPLHLIQYYGHSGPGAGPGRNDRFLPPDADVDIVIADPGKPPPLEEPKEKKKKEPEKKEPVKPEPVKPAPPKPKPIKPALPKPKNPCLEEELRITEIQIVGTKLMAEVKRLSAQIEELKIEERMIRVTASFNFLIDTISTSLTMTATTLGGPVASLGGSMIQNIVAETVKLFMHKLFRDDPANFWTNLAKAETAAAVAAAVGAKLEAFVAKKAAGAMTKKAAETLVEQAGRAASGAVQMAYSMYCAGHDATTSRMKRQRIWQRIKTLRELRKTAFRYVQIERGKRHQARVALVECRAKHAAPSIPAPSSTP